MDILEVKKIWSEIKVELRDVIPAHAFYSWFDSIEPVGFDNNIFSLITVHQLAPQIVRQNYFKQISEALKKHFGHDVDFDIQYDAAFAEKYIKEKKKESAKPKSIHADEDEEQKKVLDNLAKMQSFSSLKITLSARTTVLHMLLQWLLQKIPRKNIIRFLFTERQDSAKPTLCKQSGIILFLISQNFAFDTLKQKIILMKLSKIFNATIEFREWKNSVKNTEILTYF